MDAYFEKKKEKGLMLLSIYLGTLGRIQVHDLYIYILK